MQRDRARSPRHSAAFRPVGRRCEPGIGAGRLIADRAVRTNGVVIILPCGKQLSSMIDLPDLPLKFHPVAIRVSGDVTPFGAG
jgi:hypothetical protein